MFHSLSNDYASANRWLYYAMLYLLIDAYFNFIVGFCWWCNVCIGAATICFLKEDKALQRHSTLSFRDTLTNLGGLKMRSGDFRVSHKCPIWGDKFEKNVEVISLPCNSSHIFHYACISSWVLSKPKWPIWKEEVSSEDIEFARNEDSDYDHKLVLESRKQTKNRQYFQYNV